MAKKVTAEHPTEYYTWKSWSESFPFSPNIKSLKQNRKEIEIAHLPFHLQTQHNQEKSPNTKIVSSMWKFWSLCNTYTDKNEKSNMLSLYCVQDMKQFFKLDWHRSVMSLVKKAYFIRNMVQMLSSILPMGTGKTLNFVYRLLKVTL